MGIHLVNLKNINILLSISLILQVFIAILGNYSNRFFTSSTRMGSELPDGACITMLQWYVSSVSMGLTSMRVPPFLLTMTGMLAAGCTTAEVPMTSMQSERWDSSKLRSSTSLGMGSPNITVSPFIMPPQWGHSGGVPGMLNSWRGHRVWHEMHRIFRALP